MHYLNTQNIFYKNILIKDNLKNSIIFTKDNNIKKNILIQSCLNNHIVEIKTLWDFIDAIKNNLENYIVDYNIFFTKLPNNWEIETKNSITISKNQEIEIDEIIKKLSEFWYNFWDFLEDFSYKKLWDTLHIKNKSLNKTIIISFFWSVVEDIYLENWINSKKLEQITFWNQKVINFYDLNEDFNTEILDLFWEKHIILDNIDILPWVEKLEKIKNKTSFDILKNPNLNQTSLEVKDLFLNNIEDFIKILKGSKKISIYTKNIKNIKNFLEYNNLDALVFETNLNILKSFETPKEIYICDDNLFKIFTKKRLKKSLSQNIDLLLSIKQDDFVVHIDHWVWVFKWIIKKEVWKDIKEYLEIDYLNNDKLFVPITETSRVSKYIWKENPKLTSLSTKEWTKKLEKVSKDVQIVAMELLEIYAKRKLQKWFSFVYNREKMREFEHSFEYVYTDWQINAIDEIMIDMEKDFPMERVLVWDVWFWKTEVAFNAIYNAFLNKKQSILISPLVVLSYEHYQKAIERFSAFPIQIELLTRFQTSSEAKNILKKLKSWDIDLIIWTHRLLSEKIEYKDLWLLIIDEEHKFWVNDKEKIKKLKQNIDLLSMSATPIPRSLNMALSWIKNISILPTPPENRKWVETFVSKFDENIIFQACKKEFDSWGQVFFIHNRVSTIENMEKILQNIFKDKKIIITHGQLNWDELENRILSFKQKKYDILLSSTVIENWIDFPNVNTIIINDAYKFWVSQIHQLRWRVWRKDKLWTCYLLYKWDFLTEDRAKRLQTLVEYSYLWAWFELSMRDLELRWWGDILGLNQSWLTSEVWISVYLKMLEEKMQELKQSLETWKEIEKKQQTLIDLNIPAFLDDNFFENDLDKLEFYKEIETISDLDDLENLINDFTSFNKNIPKESENLFNLLKIKLESPKYNIKHIKREWVLYKIIFEKNIKVEDLKKFLDLDKKVLFIVEDLTSIKSPCRNFNWDNDFLNYLLKIMFFTKKVKIKSINLKKVN